MTFLPTAFPLPRGKDNESLYQNLRLLVDTLRRVQQTDTSSVEGIEQLVADLEASVEAANTSIAQIQDDIDNISTGGLTAQQLFLLERYAGGVELLGAGLRIAQDALEWVQAAGEAGLENLVRIEDLSTGIRVFQKTIHSETLALASQITAVQASLATTNAAIVTEQTARATGDAANATAISTVSTTVGGLSATVSTQQTSINGLQAFYSVKLQAGNRMGFFQMNGSTAEVNVVFGVDKFVIMHPSDTGSTAVPFVVGQVNGVNTVGINGALVVDGTIVARHIGAGEITAGKIAAGAVTADKMSVGSLAAINAVLGSVTTARIQSPDGKLDINGLSTPYIRITT